MAFDEAMSLTARMMTQAQALAAMTARLRLVDIDTPADPAVRAQLDHVADVLGVREAYDSLDADQRRIVVSFARSYLRQALDLMEEPERRGAWVYTDPTILQTQGQASRVIAGLIEGAGIGRPGARILDIGVGVAGLACAFCTTFPGSTVVGLDPWEPALVLARENVAREELGDRITLVQTAIEDYEDAEGFDLVWFPTFFVPQGVLDAAMGRVAQLARPGATVVLGAFQAGTDPLAGAIDDLMTVRSGGTPLNPADAIARLERAGFVNVREIERTWNAPVHLVVGERP